MKNLTYIANIRLPTEKAHGLQIMKMCEAFADLELKVTLVVPRRETLNEDPFDYYGVKRNFTIRKLWCWDTISWGRIGFWIETVMFAQSVLWNVLSKNGVFYTRDESIAFFLSLLGKNVVWEAHMGHKNLFVRALASLRISTVSITSALKDFYKKIGFSDTKISVFPDGVDIDQFSTTITQSEAREITNLPMDKKIVLYTGHLYLWKGADILAEAAKKLDESIKVVFVGGTDKHINDYKERYKDLNNVMIVGRRPHQSIPLYLKSADVLVIPNSSREDISRLYTSPMKLFEYMASGVPIVASDLPSLKEVLDNSTAFFFLPDDSKSLASTIEEVLNEATEAKEKGRRSMVEVRKYSWQNRAQGIINFIFK